jgi:hypothetical protein
MIDAALLYMRGDVSGVIVSPNNMRLTDRDLWTGELPSSGSVIIANSLELSYKMTGKSLHLGGNLKSVDYKQGSKVSVSRRGDIAAGEGTFAVDQYTDAPPAGTDTHWDFRRI